MGIIVDVNLLYKGELEYLQIIVDKYPSLISFRGKYYYRSGSTMREITGKELERALLKTQGRTWDGVPLPKLSVSDLKQDAIQLFKDKAVKRGRLTKEEVSVEDTILMDNLHLIDEDGYLIRAAMLAFYKDPEKWVTGSYIKIGYFGKSDSDLVYQDEVHGPLIEQVDKTVDLVYTKYMKALIDYEGVQRIEQFMFHKDAFREILLNAIVHKDYSSCNPIQISVYKDKIYIWNDGEMPPNLDSTDKLFMKHSSKPYNPKLANIFFKSGMIEAWGRGFEKIREACALYDGPLPEYEINEAGIMVLLYVLNIGRGEANNIKISSLILDSKGSTWDTELRTYKEIATSSGICLMFYKELSEREWKEYSNKMLEEPFKMCIDIEYDDLVGFHHKLNSLLMVKRFVHIRDEDNNVIENVLVINPYDSTIQNMTSIDS